MLTHSLVGGLTYVLKANGVVVAKLRKEDGAFRIAELQDKPHGDQKLRTMKATKAHVETLLPAELLAKPVKAKKYTLRDYASMCGPSHTGLRIYVTEAQKVWPGMKGSELAAYLIRKHMENLAAFKWTISEWARKWLAANPEVGAYDEFEEARRLAQLYPNDVWA